MSNASLRAAPDANTVRPPAPRDPKAVGRERLAARRRRTHRIRVIVAGALVATFIALFAVIYIQMALGKDPALGASTTEPLVAQSAPSTRASATTAAHQRAVLAARRRRAAAARARKRAATAAAVAPAQTAAAAATTTPTAATATTSTASTAPTTSGSSVSSGSASSSGSSSSASTPAPVTSGQS